MSIAELLRRLHKEWPTTEYHSVQLPDLIEGIDTLLLTVVIDGSKYRVVIPEGNTLDGQWVIDKVRRTVKLQDRLDELRGDA